MRSVLTVDQSPVGHYSSSLNDIQRELIEIDAADDAGLSILGFCVVPQLFLWRKERLGRRVRKRFHLSSGLFR